MRKGNFTFCNQKYEGFIIIETMKELITYIEKIADNPYLSSVRKTWFEIINMNRLLIINPMNGVSYFFINKEVEIEYIS